MPLLNSRFRPPRWLPGGHLQTLYPFFFRRVATPSEPVEVPLPDGDRLVADWYPSRARHNDAREASAQPPLLIVAHGMEGSSQRPYVVGLAAQALARGYAVLAWNLRGCGRADNLLAKSYYAGCSDDLDAVIHWARRRHSGPISLAGFSMGGNVTLKWLGEAGDRARARGVVSAAVVSVPCDLLGCNQALEEPRNFLYRRRFVRDLKGRLRAKAERFPDEFDLAPLRRITTVRAFDDHYTAPMHGFDSAEHYYHECSANRFLPAIATPTLLLNARNDPFLAPSCFPEALAAEHAWLYLEAPADGGHVGFFSRERRWWEADRVCAFLDAVKTEPTQAARASESIPVVS